MHKKYDTVHDLVLFVLIYLLYIAKDLAKKNESDHGGAAVTVSDIHRYSKYILTYQLGNKTQDTTFNNTCVIPPHLISEELVLRKIILQRIF